MSKISKPRAKIRQLSGEDLDLIIGNLLLNKGEYILSSDNLPFVTRSSM